ncbi:MAG: hypothetical protein IIA60_10515 [Candidatus Marinimicrobia bacterium]|nr:hypothetical protein [Candidatus Neomarinimicrobiota bacterium]
MPAGTVPEWRLDLTLEDIRWPVPGTGDELIIPRVEIRGEDQTLSWLSPAGRLGSGTIALSGTLDRLFSGGATISARLRAAVPVPALRRFVADSAGWSADGRIECDLTAFGLMSEWREARVAGTVRSEGVTVRDSSWSFDSAAVAFILRSDGERVTVQQLSWRAGESEGTVTGEIDGLVALVRSGFDSPDLTRARLDVRSPYLNLDQLIGEDTAPADSLMPETPVPGTRAADSLVTDTVVASLIRLLAAGTIEADTVIYSGLTLSHVRSQYDFKNIFIDDGGLGAGVFDQCLEDRQTRRKVIAINNLRKAIEHNVWKEPRKRNSVRECTKNTIGF